MNEEQKRKTTLRMKRCFCLTIISKIYFFIDQSYCRYDASRAPVSAIASAKADRTPPRSYRLSSIYTSLRAKRSNLTIKKGSIEKDCFVALSFFQPNGFSCSSQ